MPKRLFREGRRHIKRQYERNKKKCKNTIRALLILIAISGIYFGESTDNNYIAKFAGKLQETPLKGITKIVVSEVPEFDGTTPYVVINNGIPTFAETDYTTEVFEVYSELDDLGRCQVAFANISQEIMPTEPRTGIGMIKPSGWQIIKYDDVDGKYLYNRCHLIGYQLAGENANDRNLITGTRYLNVEGMLPFENQVADYVQETAHHVLYRVTPIYEGDNLLADGVLLEAASVEDEVIRLNVYIYNEQPGIHINHKNGMSSNE